MPTHPSPATHAPSSTTYARAPGAFASPYQRRLLHSNVAFMTLTEGANACTDIEIRSGPTTKHASPPTRHTRQDVDDVASTSPSTSAQPSKPPGSSPASRLDRIYPSGIYSSMSPSPTSAPPDAEFYHSLRGISPPHFRARHLPPPRFRAAQACPPVRPVAPGRRQPAPHRHTRASFGVVDHSPARPRRRPRALADPRALAPPAGTTTGAPQTSRRPSLVAGVIP